MTRLVLQFNQALCLTDAVDDERFDCIQYLIEKRKFDPNGFNDRGFSVVHYCCGIDNIRFAEQVLFYLFQHGAKVNVPTAVEGFTALHIAAMNDRVSIAKILLKQGADKKCVDADGNPPIYYAISNMNMTMVDVIRNYILYEKSKAKKQNSRELLESAHLNSFNGSGVQNVLNSNLTLGAANAAYLDADMSITPSRIVYNFDSASPYFVNITHRRKILTCAAKTMFVPEKPSNLNVFELTEDNLAEFSKSIRESGRFEMFQRWKEKIEEHKKRQSMMSSVIDECEQFLGHDGQFVEDNFMTEDESVTFVTADETQNEENLEVPVRESDFIRSPAKDEMVFQMTERYIHTDDEENIVFYERKFLPVDGNEVNDVESESGSASSAPSTGFKINTDYDTDQLRQELTRFGDVPGPITKSTKKLYLKRLVKYRRDPQMAAVVVESKTSHLPVYSLELQKTFPSIHQGDEVFAEFLMYEEEMVRHFLQKNVKKMREGNKKMSFIYLLMDPRDLNSLSANYRFLSKEQAWRQFIKSIFYVGKGKKSRPYAHLYEAIRHFSNADKENGQIFNRHPQRAGPRLPPLTGNQFCETEATDSKKLNRILDIWVSGNGVVSVHIFHNITPSEAYTREAAMIDAIGMNNLTNQVRGHYYGITESWNFKQRKQLGVGLLYKALQIHLIEGESQLFPNDI